MYDYLVKMAEFKSSGTPTNFSGTPAYCQIISHRGYFHFSLLNPSETQLLWMVSDLFIAGGETTITTIRWILLCLAKYPQGQERVRQEIVNVFGWDSTPT